MSSDGHTMREEWGVRTGQGIQPPLKRRTPSTVCSRPWSDAPALSSDIFAEAGWCEMVVGVIG
jgi:hypothetical protein